MYHISALPSTQGAVEFSHLLPDLIGEIIERALPCNPTPGEKLHIKFCHSEISKFLSLSKPIYAAISRICQQRFTELRELFFFSKKYNKFVTAYGTLPLFDALATGSSVPSSFNAYNPEIEADIKKMVTLSPQVLSLQSNIKDYRFATPLFLAALNPAIPVEIIEFLLVSGANPRVTLVIDRKITSLFLGITNRCPKNQRLTDICHLFKRYKMDENTFKNHREIALAYVQQHGFNYALQSTYASDFDIILAAVQLNGYALEYASDELRADKEIVLAAVQQDGYALEDASKELHADKEIVLAAVQQSGLGLLCNSKLGASKEIVMVTVQQNGHALGFASDKLRANKEIVRAAVQQHGCALKHASDGLRADKEIVLAAINSHPFALKYASEELIFDKQIILQIMQYRPDVYSSNLKNADTALKAVQNGLGLGYVAPELHDNYPIVLAAVRNNGNDLKLASKRLRGNFQIVLAAVHQNGSALKYASDEIHSQKVTITTAKNNI